MTTSTYSHPVKRGAPSNPKMLGAGAPIETIRIGMVADGDTVKLAHIQEEMRAEERDGWFRILRMDDREAVIQWQNAHVMLLIGPDGGSA